MAPLKDHAIQEISNVTLMAVVQNASIHHIAQDYRTLAIILNAYVVSWELGATRQLVTFV